MKRTLQLLLIVFLGLTATAQTITIDHQLPTAAPYVQYQPGIFAVPKTSNGVYIDVPEQELRSVVLLNNLGEQVAVLHQNQFSMKSFGSGIYYVIVETADGFTTRKLIKK